MSCTNCFNQNPGTCRQDHFAFDPAHNILSGSPADGGKIPDNRIREYGGTGYYYDGLGNLIHRELPDGGVQNYFYDLHDQLVKAEIFRKDGGKETWHYVYDALGRRIAKYKELSDGLRAEEREFIWDGSRLLQEVHADKTYTYVYTGQDSYEPLAQIADYPDGSKPQQIHYFHCDQIGIPREMTDEGGQVVWTGCYNAWGYLKEESKAAASVYQPFRLQNQYFDKETGLHYNFFRYYEPNCGRFISQDPIKLAGGMNLYQFASNAQEWIDPLGLEKFNLGHGYTGRADYFPIKNGTSFEIHVFNPRGQEVGMYGPDGWFNKHGHRGKPEGLPDSVENACRGKAVEIGRRLGVIHPKGAANIKGNRLGNFFARIIPGLSTAATVFEPSPQRACNGINRLANENTCQELGE